MGFHTQTQQKKEQQVKLTHGWKLYRKRVRGVFLFIIPWIIQVEWCSMMNLGGKQINIWLSCEGAAFSTRFHCRGKQQWIYESPNPQCRKWPIMCFYMCINWAWNKLFNISRTAVTKELLELWLWCLRLFLKEPRLKEWSVSHKSVSMTKIRRKCFSVASTMSVCCKTRWSVSDALSHCWCILLDILIDLTSAENSTDAVYEKWECIFIHTRCWLSLFIIRFRPAYSTVWRHRVWH